MDCMRSVGFLGTCPKLQKTSSSDATSVTPGDMRWTAKR